MSKKNKAEHDYDDYSDYKNESDELIIEKRKSRTSIIIALISLLSTIIITLIPSYSKGLDDGKKKAEEYLLPTIAALETKDADNTRKIAVLETQLLAVHQDTQLPTNTGAINGLLTDRFGAGLPNMTVSVAGSGATKTDTSGNFIIENIPPGHQLIKVQAPTLNSQFTQNINIQSGGITDIKLIFDTQTMQLRLLSITSLVNNGSLEVEAGTEHRQIISGRCDGLAQIYGGFENFQIWVVVRAIQDDERYWVQHPSVVIDRNSNTWSTNTFMGSDKFPPYDGQMWVVMAIATPVNSGMEKILNFSEITDLPFSVITSNVVSLVMKTK